jgi:hypothetical protein
MTEKRVIVRKFPKMALLRMLDRESEVLKIVEEKIVDSSRWSLFYKVVFEELETGKLYQNIYSVGATELQDEGPWEYSSDPIDCFEVTPVEKVVTVYEAVYV